MPLTSRALAIAMLAICLGRPAAAAFPERPVQVILPYGPGGSIDLIARVLAPCMGARLGQPVVVVNRPGANGDVGAIAARNARPDGHTLLFHASALTISAALAETPAVDLRRDLEPVTKVATAIQGLYVPATMPARTLPEFIALARATPGAFNYGSLGSVSLLATEALSGAAGLSMVPVTYSQGTPSMMTALMSNEVQLVMVDAGGAQSALETGRIRLLAVHARDRMASRPEVPTVSEILPAMTQFVGMVWYGYFAPAGTPPDIVQQLHGTIAACLTDADARAGLRRIGYEDQQLVGDGPAAFRASLEPEIARLRELGRRANIVLR